MKKIMKKAIFVLLAVFGFMVVGGSDCEGFSWSQAFIGIVMMCVGAYGCLRVYINEK